MTGVERVGSSAKQQRMKCFPSHSVPGISLRAAVSLSHPPPDINVSKRSQMLFHGFVIVIEVPADLAGAVVLDE
jgi:hypothetical protein